MRMRIRPRPLLFINEVGGSRRGLSYSIIWTIQLSGMAQEQRCPDNRVKLRPLLINLSEAKYVRGN